MLKFYYYDICAYTVLLLITCQNLADTSKDTDGSALLVLKDRITTDPHLKLTTNWTNSSSICSWIGVTCGLRHHRVTALNISYMDLSGTIPPQLGNLSFLVSLDLSYNLFSGALPQELSFLHRLRFISFGVNNFGGEIPSWLGLLPKLQYLSLSNNSFTGVLPRDIDQLYGLEELRLEFNDLSGSVPPEVFNMSTLRTLSLSGNSLSGRPPANLCYGLPVLEQLFLDHNYLSGPIPDSISNCSKLRILDLASNYFTGFVPHSLGDLRFLERLLLFSNNLRIESSSSSELSFITSLTKCRSLIQLVVGDNPLDGVVPASVGNLSSSLQYFIAFNCIIRGSIPVGIGNLSNLIKLNFFGNELSGSIPLTIGHLHKLQGLALFNNNLGGSIPKQICDLQSFYFIYLSRNQFSGPIPECIGNLTSLGNLLLDSNMLTSSIPSSLWSLKNLVKLDLSSNFLSGFLPPEMGNLGAAIHVNLSMNRLSKSIPSTIGDLQNLLNLSLAHNKLEGPIPLSMGSLISLATLDLSCNNLSGSIPMSFEALQYLDNFNVSFNALSGEIPTGGPFRNFTMESFKGNKALCGIPSFHVPICPTDSDHRSMKKVELPLFIISGVVVFITVVSLAFILIRYRMKDKSASIIDGPISVIPERISYYEISQATEQFNDCNFLGIGSFGSVYRGFLTDGRAIAVKVFNLQREDAFKSFDTECKVLRNIRHRNLVKVLSSCSSEDFKALVLEYMPSGNLENLLYSHIYCLDVMRRLDIMIDVASALEYLHYGNSTPIVHCDLKPSNVLLDEEMIAHLSDFGMAKLLGDKDSIMLTNTLATLGYIAPEYGLEGLVSTSCDVYSYGVMLMETFTRKRPSDDMFAGDLCLKSWVESSLPHSSQQVVDADLLMNVEEERFDKILHCVSSVLELALMCCAERPGERINMKGALTALLNIKCRFSQSSDLKLNLRPKSFLYSAKARPETEIQGLKAFYILPKLLITPLQIFIILFCCSSNNVNMDLALEHCPVSTCCCGGYLHR